MAHLIDQLHHFIVSSVGSWGYIAIFVLMVLESACIPIPSEVTMPVGGLLAAQGNLDFAAVVLLGTLGNLAGSLLSYWAGRSGARQLLVRYGRYVFIRPHDVERSEKWFDRYGQPAVFFSRLLPVVRTFISLPAGIAEMPIGRFSVLTFIGSLPWSFALAGAGYLLGNNWERILPYTEPVTYALATAIIIAIAIWIVRGRRRDSHP